MKLIKDTYMDGYEIEPDYDADGNPEPYSGGYMAGTGKKVYEAGDALSVRVLKRLDLVRGAVTIVEDHWDSGYCNTCSSEEIDFIVLVDGKEVYRTPSFTGNRVGGAEDLPNFVHFSKWLAGDDSIPDPYAE